MTALRKKMQELKLFIQNIAGGKNKQRPKKFPIQNNTKICLYHQQLKNRALKCQQTCQ